jgi:2TM domain
MEPSRDEKLWKIAQRRAHFQRNLMSYFFTNAILIGIWYFTSGSLDHFWPGWVLAFWGIGIVMQYYRAYIKPDDSDLAEKEYQKLLEEQKKNL